MKDRQRYNWDGMSEQIRQETYKDYKRKQTIKGAKKTIGIVLAIGIGTIGAYEFIHNKVEELREQKTKITTQTPMPVSSVTPELNSYFPIITHAPRITSTPEAMAIPTKTNGIDEQSRLEQLYNKIPRSKQIKTVMQEYQQENSNEIFESYTELEQLMNTTNPEEKRLLAEKGFMYFINMERKLLAAYVGDSVPSMYLDAKHIKATYERRGKQYEFYIRYTNSKKPISIASPILERNSDGQLIYAKNTSSSLPIELYERLIFIGSHSKYIKSDRTDIEKYAQDHTDGDVEKAILEIQDKLIAENDALFELIEDKYTPKERSGEER